MAGPLSLLQFQSPWQGRLGFKRYDLDPETGEVSQTKCVKPRKLLKKGARNLDGLILTPAWPTRHQLCILLHSDTLHLRPLKRFRVDMDAAPINILDSSFRTEIRERLLYRTFIFSDGRQQLRFSDLEGRLLGPQRTAMDVFPVEDFSPFSRLIQMLNNPITRTSLILDLQDHRLDYPKWIDRHAAPLSPRVKPA